MIREKIKKAYENLEKLLNDKLCLENIEKATDRIISAIQSGNKIMICGNGGSAADAQHFAGEFLCRFYRDRKALPAIALTTDSSTITAIGNDYSYEDIFSRQVEGLGKENDVLLGISTSGSSKNVLKAFQTAKKMNVRTILLTGEIERDIAKLSNLTIRVPSTDTPRIQEMHLLIEHIISEVVERAFVGE